MLSEKGRKEIPVMLKGREGDPLCSEKGGREIPCGIKREARGWIRCNLKRGGTCTAGAAGSAPWRPARSQSVPGPRWPPVAPQPPRTGTGSTCTCHGKGPYLHEA